MEQIATVNSQSAISMCQDGLVLEAILEDGLIDLSRNRVRVSTQLSRLGR